MSFATEYPAFFTATNLWWKPLLDDDPIKSVITTSPEFLTTHQRVIVYAFVIMPNHIHLIWQMQAGFKPADVQRDFLKYTAQQIKFKLVNTNPELLETCRVNAKDRTYQVWERNALSIEIFSTKVFQEKLKYIHTNPVRAGLCQNPEDYPYSSAAFYANLPNTHAFLRHWWDGEI